MSAPHDGAVRDVLADSQALPSWIGAAVMAAVFLLGMRLRGEQIADRY